MATSRSYYADLVQSQSTKILSTFTLESGIVLNEVPIAYSTWGVLNESKDNVIVVCHALTGSSDASDWWRPLMGPGRALDYTRFFIFCANVLGSPYGSASPLSIDVNTGKPFGPTFPDTTIRDDIRIHKLVLDSLKIGSIAAVMGGSMGGMHTLEWPLSTPKGYVKNIIPIATSAYQGAWGISWGETQRQVIYNDAEFKSGWYIPTPDGQPRSGLGAARMIGMLTYRSFASFEARFGRKIATPTKGATILDSLPTPPISENGSISLDTTTLEEIAPPMHYSAQTYLHYQADKFLNRFDANCYIHLTKKLDTHDVTRSIIYPNSTQSSPSTKSLTNALKHVPSGALVIGVESDLLFPMQQQIDIAECLPEASFVKLESNDGHDGFLLEFESLNSILKQHLEAKLAWCH